MRNKPVEEPGDNHKEAGPLPLDRLRALSKDKIKSPEPPDPSTKMPVLEREDGLFCLWIQEKLNLSGHLNLLAAKSEESSLVRAQLSSANQDLSRLERQVAALQRENAELYRQLLVAKYEGKLKEAGFIDGARIEEMPDGRFILIKAAPAPKGE